MTIKNIQDVVLPTTGSVVFVTGVTGQDGSLMVDYLLKNEPHLTIIGGARRLSVDNHNNIVHLEHDPRFQLVNFDLTDSHSIYKLMEYAKPDYFINFAAQSFVASSWDFARQTWQTNSTSVLDCLEAIKRVKPSCRFYNAGSSEEFGNVVVTPQNETHPPRPRSPYGASKAAARTLIKVYRESYGIYAVQGWLFNHEGSRRGSQFVTRKITQNVVRIKKEIDAAPKFEVPEVTPLELGNIDARRDWSDAEDMVDAVWRMLNQEIYNSSHLGLVVQNVGAKPCRFNDTDWTKMYVGQGVVKDYVCSSDVNHSIREFIEEAFKTAGIDGRWFIDMKNDPLSERFVYVDGGIPVPDVVLVRINPQFYRPAEVETLRGDSSAIRKDLNWNPKSTFFTLVKKMVDNDLKI
jgi:GDPmannose 4,6-dehydratase